MDEPYIDPEVAMWQQSHNAAWVLIGRLDMALEQLQSPHISHRDRLTLIAKVRADIKRAMVAQVSHER